MKAKFKNHINLILGMFGIMIAFTFASALIANVIGTPLLSPQFILTTVFVALMLSSRIYLSLWINRQPNSAQLRRSLWYVPILYLAAIGIYIGLLFLGFTQVH